MATKLKMSLVATYDDLMRKTKVLTESCESDFLQFVRHQEENRLKWLKSESEVEQLKRQVEELKQKNYTLEIRYEHAREQIKHESQARERSEIARVDKENQLVLIRELVSDPNRNLDRDQLDEISRASPGFRGRRASSYGAAAESSASVLDDVDWDYTDDDIIASPAYGSARRRYKRPSAPPEELVAGGEAKRYRSDDDAAIDVDVKSNSFVSKTSILVNSEGQPVEAVTKVYPNARLNKSFSESALDKRLSRENADAAIDSEVDTDEGSPCASPNTNNNNLRGILRNKQTDPLGTPGPLRKASSAGKGLNKLHMFVSRKIVLSESCAVCEKKVKFGRILKCQGCNSSVHAECKDLLSLPCLPLPTSTPGKGKVMTGKLTDFVPLTSPMVPALVVHCVREIERRGLQEVGLYRVSGSDKQVRELKDKFYRGKGLPNLSQVSDIHVVCSVLKDFFLKLKEPLITYKLWHDFAAAAEHPHQAEAMNKMCDVINRLPQPNLDTLAFLIVHLQKIADSPDCMMPITNLSTIFGMSLVGNSSVNPSPTEMMTLLPKQSVITQQLLTVPATFWRRFVDGDSCDLYPEYTSTPGQPRAAHQTRLGPISTPGSYDRARAYSTGTRPSTTPSTALKMSKRARLFNSPIHP